MGRTLASKKEIVADLKETLSETQLVFIIGYSGLSVAEITDLRNRLRPKGAICRVAKNTFMEKATEGDDRWQAVSELLKGDSAFVMVKDDLGGAIKAYQEFQKAAKKTEIRGGVMDGRVLKEADLKAIADLPSKEQLIAQIAGAINGVATQLAVGINEVPSGLARALQQLSEKDQEAA
ncbi:50S ribosomal protein L10 [Leptolyngbya sp. NIES-2104]|uniref:50S ribosomal protein L10 n=1 Tax=Leptolyngbya sp. NIES-2104 TaxID=1552121 RepID=UPI0006ECCEBE|nr:50S ribosomal protein L10 [Leptolyngbya sp. NIES-2104]GAP97757.1 LSU ribosomal protein L10p [Leptolyngbya sp. NIES-2104]